MYVIHTCASSLRSQNMYIDTCVFVYNCVCNTYKCARLISNHHALIIRNDYGFIIKNHDAFMIKNDYAFII